MNVNVGQYFESDTSIATRYAFGQLRFSMV
jgi:hypothetical protein